MNAYHRCFTLLKQCLHCFCMHTSEVIQPLTFSATDITRLYQIVQQTRELGMGGAQNPLIDSIIDYLNPTGAPLVDMTNLPHFQTDRLFERTVNLYTLPHSLFPPFSLTTARPIASGISSLWEDWGVYSRPNSHDICVNNQGTVFSWTWQTNRPYLTIECKFFDKSKNMIIKDDNIVLPKNHSGLVFPVVNNDNYLMLATWKYHNDHQGTYFYHPTLYLYDLFAQRVVASITEAQQETVSSSTPWPYYNQQGDYFYGPSNTLVCSLRI